MFFQFHGGNSIISRLIRLISNGNYNHVSIRCGKYVYEAHIKGGVKKTLYSKWDKSSVKETIFVKSSRVKSVEKWLNKQVGKKYDLLGILSFLFVITKPRKGYWYCSELAMVTYSKLKGHSGDVENQKVSPYLFYKILELNK